VFPAHSRYFGTRVPSSQTIPYFDAGYLDWRFMQEMSLAANGVLDGLWTKPGSGMEAVCSSAAAPARNGAPAAPAAPADRRCTFVYGTGGVSMPIGMAYEAAGLK